MPTNDERREAAARLRNLNPYEWGDFSDEYNDLRWACLCGRSEYCGMELHERLADLIEPEPICIANLTFTAEQQEEVFQRVIKEMQAKKPTLVLYENEAEVCPECGEPLPDYANFCPNCGAKVVSE